MATTERILSIPELHPQDPNAGYLELHLQRLRLRLQRRVLWLRRQWKQDPLQDFQSSVISDEQADRLLHRDDYEAESRFYSDDEAAALLSREILTLEDQLAAQSQLLFEAGTPPALELLVHLFGLNTWERDLLLLCFAPVYDSSFARLYAYVHDDVNLTQPTLNLALSLFSEQERSAALDSLLPDAPLRRFRLVNVSDTRTLSIDERIVSYINGINHPDERIAGWLSPLPPALFPSSHREPVENISQWIRLRRTSNTALPRLNLVGPAGAGKRTLARAIADRLEMQIVRLDLQFQTVSELQAGVRLLEREAVLLQTAFYVNATQFEHADVTTHRLLNYLIEHARALVIAGSAEPLRSERSMVIVRVNKPDAQVRLALWRQALAGTGQSFNGELEGLAQQFDLGPNDISQVVTLATEQVRMRGLHAAAVGAADLWDACRERATFDLEGLAQRLAPAYEWKDIVLPEDVLRQLEELAAQVAGRHHVYEHWGFGAKLTRGRGISALFSGPSGTGKTMAAEILANHLQLDLYRIDLAGIVSKYIGETEKNLKRVFEVAERTAAILFFDEADALFSKRTDVKDAHDRYANLEVNYLLQRMEDYRGLAILATNRKSDLDRAFLRRLRFLIDFPFPDAGSRRRIWQQVFPDTAELGEIDYDWLARLDIAGGSIRNISLNAAFLAANTATPIDMRHLVHATRREYSKLDKLIVESEFVS